MFYTKLEQYQHFAWMVKLCATGWLDRADQSGHSHMSQVIWTILKRIQFDFQSMLLVALNVAGFPFIMPIQCIATAADDECEWISHWNSTQWLKEQLATWPLCSSDTERWQCCHISLASCQNVPPTTASLNFSPSFFIQFNLVICSY